MLKEDRPQIVFLMETKLNARRMDNVPRRWGFNKYIDVPANVTRGGLCLSCTCDVNIQLRSFLINHIDVEIGKNGV